VIEADRTIFDTTRSQIECARSRRLERETRLELATPNLGKAEAVV